MSDELKQTFDHANITALWNNAKFDRCFFCHARWEHTDCDVGYRVIVDSLASKILRYTFVCENCRTIGVKKLINSSDTYDPAITSDFVGKIVSLPELYNEYMDEYVARLNECIKRGTLNEWRVVVALIRLLHRGNELRPYSTRFVNNRFHLDYENGEGIVVDL